METACHWSLQNMLIHVHEDDKPVSLMLPDLELCQKIRQEQPGRSRDVSVGLDVLQLLLVYCFVSLWGLASHVVGRDNPISVLWIAVE